MKRTIIIVMGLLSFFSCKGIKNVYKKGYTESYVLEYYSISGIEAFWRRDSYIEVTVAPDGYKYGVLSENEKDKARYKAKCQAHGDVGYNRDFYYGYGHFPNRFQDRDYAAIKITSDADYDDSHPAGTPLNDLFYFASSSPIGYIKRGYKDPYDWGDYASLPAYYIYYLDMATIPNYGGNSPVYGLLSDLSAEDFVLLGGTEDWRVQTLAILAPTKEPTIDKTHNITIVFTDTEGNELDATVRIEL